MTPRVGDDVQPQMLGRGAKRFLGLCVILGAIVVGVEPTALAPMIACGLAFTAVAVLVTLWEEREREVEEVE